MKLTETVRDSLAEPHMTLVDSSLDSTEPTIVHDLTIGLDGLRVPPLSGGLVLLGPTAAPLSSLDALLNTPNAVPVQAHGARLASWITSPDELILLTREVSRVIRAGQTAVVHLDSHIDRGDALPIDAWDFVCWRLGRIMLGMADAPAYVTVHGDHMARGLIAALGDDSPAVIGAINGDIGVLQLSSKTMFPELVVAVTPAERVIEGAVHAVDWFEARRS